MSNLFPTQIGSVLKKRKEVAASITTDISHDVVCGDLIRIHEEVPQLFLTPFSEICPRIALVTIGSRKSILRVVSCLGSNGLMTNVLQFAWAY
jgi:hypothetical protein